MYVTVVNYSGYLSRVAQESSPIKQTVTNLLSEISVYNTSSPGYPMMGCYIIPGLFGHWVLHMEQLDYLVVY